MFESIKEKRIDLVCMGDCGFILSAFQLFSLLEKNPQGFKCS